MTATATKVHPFEAAGLGQAPFRYVGYSESKFQAAPGEPIRAGSSCDYCGTAIMGVFTIRSADGKTFKVGCDCLRKTFTEFDGTIPPQFRREIARVDAQKRDAKREAAREKLRARIAAASAMLKSRPALFADRPHPHAGLAANGKTLRDYYAWMLTSAGTAGRTDACLAIERAVQRTPPTL